MVNPQRVCQKAGLTCIVLAALAIVAYGQTNARQRAHSTNLQGASSGYLGVGVQDIDAEKVKTLNLKDNSGVVVTSVTEGAPGAKAGIRVNDVIVDMNGQKMTSQEQVQDAIIGKSPGAKINLTILRSGARQDVVATLGTRPPDLPLTSFPGGAMPVGPMAPGDLAGMAAAMGAAMGTVDAPRAGFDCVDLMPQLAEFFGVQEGVLVESVSLRSPAEKAGLKAGDIVTKVNGIPVASAREVSAVMRQANKKLVTFTVLRNKKEVTLNLELAWSHADPFDRDPVN